MRADQQEELQARVLLRVDFLTNFYLFFLVKTTYALQKVIKQHFLKISMHYYRDNEALPVCIGLNLCSRIYS